MPQFKTYFSACFRGMGPCTETNKKVPTSPSAQRTGPMQEDMRQTKAYLVFSKPPQMPSYKALKTESLENFIQMLNHPAIFQVFNLIRPELNPSQTFTPKTLQKRIEDLAQKAPQIEPQTETTLKAIKDQKPELMAQLWSLDNQLFATLKDSLYQCAINAECQLAQHEIGLVLDPAQLLAEDQLNAMISSTQVEADTQENESAHILGLLLKDNPLDLQGPTQDKGPSNFALWQYLMTKDPIINIPNHKLRAMLQRLQMNIGSEQCVNKPLFYASLVRENSVPAIDTFVQNLIELNLKALPTQALSHKKTLLARINPMSLVFRNLLKPNHSSIIVSQGPGSMPSRIITSVQGTNGRLNMIDTLNPDHITHRRFTEFEQSMWCSGDKNSMRYLELPFEAQSVDQAGIWLKKLFDVNDVSPVQGLVKNIHRLEANKAPSQKLIQSMTRQIHQLEDHNYLNQFDEILEKAYPILNQLKDRKPLKNKALQALREQAKTIEQLAKPLDRHLPYSLRKGVTCQTFSALAIHFLMRLQTESLSSQIEPPQTNLHLKPQTFLDQVIASSQNSSTHSTLHSRKDIFLRGFLQAASPEKAFQSLQSKGMGVQAPLYIQAALGTRRLDQLDTYKP